GIQAGQAGRERFRVRQVDVSRFLGDRGVAPAGQATGRRGGGGAGAMGRTRPSVAGTGPGSTGKGALMSSTMLPRIASPADLQALSETELEQLAREMRDELIGVVGRRSAHFASNLGVVELCLALHLTFDFARDRLIWDTGHQIYPHKLITGRAAEFDSMRTRGGLMGYPNPHESLYDLFMTGHAGCSVSCALGLKVGDELLGHGDRYSVAVVGDGALPSGIVFEALNNAGGLGKNLIVILNDNKMSICPRLGG